MRAPRAALERELKEKVASRAAAADQLRETEQAIAVAARKLRTLGEDLAAARAELATHERELRRLEAQTAARQAQLARLLRYQFRPQEADALAIRLAGVDPNATARDRYFLTLLSRAKADLIADLRHDAAETKRLATLVRQRGEKLAELAQREEAERATLRQRQQDRQVDHDNDFLSVYGNTQTLLADVGQRVNAGKTVATVGASGGGSRNRVYTLNSGIGGQAFDPGKWLGAP